MSLLAVNWPVNYLLVGQIVRKKFALKSAWIGACNTSRDGETQSFGVTESVAMTAYAKLLQSDYYCMGTLRAASGHKGARSQVRAHTCFCCGYICNSQKKTKNLLHTKFSCKLLHNKLTHDDDSRSRAKGLYKYCGDIVQQHQLKLI